MFSKGKNDSVQTSTETRSNDFPTARIKPSSSSTSSDTRK